MTQAASGTATSIAAPATEGTYYIYVIDATGNISSASTATLTVDDTAPTAAITYNSAAPYTNSDTVTITATFNEAMADSPVVKIGITGVETLAATAMTKVSTTVYTYTYQVPAGDGVQTISLSDGTDVAGNTVTGSESLKTNALDANE